MKITLFKDVFSSEPAYIDLKKIVYGIKTGEKGFADVKNVRDIFQSKGKCEEYDEAKKKLSVICFNGEFSKRSKDGLTKGSGLLILDFDHIKGLEELKAHFRHQDWVILMFDSPSGDGIKVVCRIPIVKSDEEFKQYYASFQQKYPKMDGSGKDISRACFYSYDPDLYYNPQAKEYTEKIVNDKSLNSKRTFTDYGAVNTALNLIRNAVDGEKHTMTLKASNLMGRYITEGKISEQRAEELLIQEIEQCGFRNLRDKLKTVRDGISHGKTLTQTEARVIEKTKTGKGKCYFTLADVRDKFEDIYTHGYQKGYDIGWENARDKVTVKLGTTTYVYSAPYMGKSQFWNQVLVNLSRFYGLKHAILTPETGDAAEVFAELCSIYIGKSFHGNFKMTAEEKMEAEQFIDRHFLVIDGEDKGLSLNDFLDQVDAAERDFNVKISTMTIDPFNELEIDTSVHGNRDDKYLDVALKKFRQVCKKLNRHGAIVTHVKDQDIKKEGNQMYYDLASARDIAMGQVWYRKGLQMLSVYRPVDIKGNPLSDENGEPYEKNETHVYVQKSKPKGIGAIGVVKLFYDWQKNNYYELDGTYNKKYARKFEEAVVEKEETAIKPNDDFDDAPF
jgi:hypothetical protein